MRTHDFIESVATGKRTRAGHTANVLFDGTHLFSYGYHYPLLVKVGKKWFLNDAGYSVTTGKHIRSAGRYSSGSYNYHFRDNPGTPCHGSPDTNPGTIRECIRGEIKNIGRQLRTLSKRAFRQKAIKVARRNSLRNSLNVLARAWKAKDLSI